MNMDWPSRRPILASLTKQLVAGVMSVLLIAQPMIAGAQLAADPNAGANNSPNIGKAPNGVPSIDIARPNNTGLSHNKYNDFNIGNPGVILNNYKGDVGISQLGGVMTGNPNLQNANPASVILNEVTSGNRSALSGPAEVFGQKANVIIANPNGITCDGCGFINTPRATLTTGVPQIGADGRLTGFDVRNGNITFGPKGSNLVSGAGSVDILDIVSRTVTFNGPVAGHDISITAGTGKYDYASREMKELYDISGKPEYAIDGSDLGALQADKIKVIATEKGVGVRMRNDMAANAGQLTLSADGKLSLNNVSGRDGVKVASRNKKITAKKITSKQNVNIKAREGITIETISADGDLMVNSGVGLLSIQDTAISGGKLELKSDDAIQASQVASGKDMSIDADKAIDILVAVANGQATLHSKNGDIRAKNGIKASGGDLNITADSGTINASTLISFNNLSLNAGSDINITGNAIASKNINTRALGATNAQAALAGQDIRLESEGSVNVSTLANGLDFDALNNTGDLKFVRSAELSLVSKSGDILTDNAYSTHTIDFSAQQNTIIRNTLAASSDVSIFSGTLIGNNLVAGQALIGNPTDSPLDSNAKTTITALMGNLQFEKLFSGGSIVLTANKGSISSKQLQTLADLTISARNGSIAANQYYAGANVHFNALNAITVDGQSYSGGEALYEAQTTNLGQATVNGNLTINSASITANNLITYASSYLSGRNIDLQTLLASNDIVINTNYIHADKLISGIDFDKTGQTGQVEFRNYGKTSINASDHISIGQAISADTLTLTATNDIEYNQLLSYKDAILKSEQGRLSLENTLIGEEGISLSAKSLDFSNNRAQNLKTAKTLVLNAGTIDFSNSTLSYGGLIANAWNVFNVQNTNLTTNSSNGGDGDIKLTLPSLVTSTNTHIIADHDLTINTSSTVDNYGSLAAFHDLNITSSDFNNYAKLQSQKNLLIKAAGNLTNYSQGLIYAGGNGSLFVNGALLNEFGTIMSQADLQLANYDGNGKNTSITNKAGFIQAGQNLSILTQYLLNQSDFEPVIVTDESISNDIQFDVPDYYDILCSGTEGCELGYDHKNKTWGKEIRDKNNSVKVWHSNALYANQEQAYSKITINGVTYHTNEWVSVKPHNRGRVSAWRLARERNGGQAPSMRTTTQTSHFVDKDIKRGLIQANSNMDISADQIDNRYSNIEAGGNARIDANVINNTGATTKTVTSITCNSSSRCIVYDQNGLIDETKSFKAGGSEVLDESVNDSISGLIKAGGNLVINAATINNKVAEGTIVGHTNYEAVGKSVDPISIVNALPGGLFTTIVDLNHLQRQNGNVDITAAIAHGDIPTPKANSGGFGGTLPHQYFVYETRADFLDIGKFYGSSYYLSHIGYNPDHKLLFLGDAYFENQLIDKQMRELVGQGFGKGSFIPGNDAISQMKNLLDAGADYSSEHGLTFGEPLSAEQVAKLDKSIVVYVKQNVNGAEVYAPVLYVSSKDRASVETSGAVIQGGSVDITTDNITHSGLIASNSDLRLNANDILSNGGGFAAKGNVQLASTGRLQLNGGTTKLNGQDVIVPSQAIDAGGTALLSAGTDLNLNGVGVNAGENVGLFGKNVNIGTAKTNTANGSESLTGSNIEAGKNLQVKADQNINVAGSNVHAGDQLAMSADKGNLTIQSAGANGFDPDSKYVSQLKSDINSGGNMGLSSGENVVIAGSDVKAGGSLGIDAGKNVAIVSAQEEKTDTIYGKQVSDTTIQRSSNVSAGKNMGIKASEDILVGASHLNAGGNAALEAGGNINVISEVNHSEEHFNSGHGLKVNKEQNTNAGSSITTGGNLTAIAGKDGQVHDLNIVGSEITADGKIGLKATNDVNILASEDTYHYDRKSKSKGGMFKKSRSSSKNEDITTTNGSSILGKDGVNIQSGNSTTISASDIMAGTVDKTADLNINAGGNLIVASGKDTESNQSNKKTKGFASSSSKSKNAYDEYNVAANIGASGNINTHSDGHTIISGSNVMAGKDINIDGSSITIMGAQENHSLETKKKSTGFGLGSGSGFYSIYGSEGKEKKSERTDNIGSYIMAGNDVHLQANNSDVNIIGSQIDTKHDIVVDAARDVNITPGKESQMASKKKTRSGIGIQIGTSNSGASLGLGYAKGTDKTSEDHRLNAQTELNAGNNLAIKAGRDVNAQAAKLSAGRDVNLEAENNVNLLSANDVSNYKEMHERLFAGVTATVSSGLATTADNVYNTAKRIGDGNGDWKSDVANGYFAISGIMGIAGSLKPQTPIADNPHHPLRAGTLAQNKKANTVGGPLAISAGVELGFNSSKYVSTTTTTTPVVTTVEGGRSVNITANNGSITAVGTQIVAGTNQIWNLLDDAKAGDINLKAQKSVDLRSAIGSTETKRNYKSMGAGAGVSFPGAVPSGHAEFNNNNYRGNGIYNVNTHVIGNGTVSIETGDLNLIGAVVAGERVKAKVSGNMNIESLPDTEKVRHRQQSGGFVVNADSIGANWQNTTASGDYSSVVEQSGINAGNGGFDIDVAGHSDLKGGLIQSSATADKNRFKTGTITVSDIENYSRAKAKSKGYGINLGGMHKEGQEDESFADSIKQSLGSKYVAGKNIISNTINGSTAQKSKDGYTKSAISNGTIIITNDEGQKALTGKGAEETIAMINRDTGHANKPVDKIDVNKVEKKAEFKQQFKQDLLNEAFKHGDAAYKAMFLEKAPVGVIETDKNGKPILDIDKDEKGNKVERYRYRWLTDEEKKHMEKDVAEGKVQVFTNGIFNREQDAANNAVHYVGTDKGPIYFVHSQQADTAIGELLTAAYEKLLDKRLIGLTNASAQIEELNLLYGRNGLHLYGHSRGSMIIYNAMGALHDDGAAGDVLAKTGVNFFEPAANAQKTAQRLKELSGGKQDTVILENHGYDFVGRVIGGNPATNYKIPEGSTALREFLKVFISKGPTVHGCSGPAASQECNRDYGKYKPVIVGPNGVKK